MLIGVDAGGSHTEVVVSDGTNIQCRKRGPAAAVRPEQIEHSTDVISGLIDEAIRECGCGERPEAVVVGAAGAGRDRERGDLEESMASSVGIHVLLRVTTDAEIALESAFPRSKPGIVLASGTGSVAFARTDDGRTVRTGGLGWQFGDEGSGYAMGRAALGAAGRAADQRGPDTMLYESIARATHSQSLDDMVRWATTADREAVAALALEVLAAAAGKDHVAQELIDEAVQRLFEHVRVLAEKFSSDSQPELALSGGLLDKDSLIRNQLIVRLGVALPRIALSDATVDPAMGAVSLAAALVRR